VDPVICMITGAVAGEETPDNLIERVAAAAQAGVSLIQVRAHHLEAGALFDLVTRCVRAVHGTQSRIIVNDRLDVALGANAHGVHLRGDSVPARRMREVTPPGFLVGRSVHDLAHAVAATEDGGLDYLIFGTVFPSSSKPGHVAAGLEALDRVSAATSLPVLAVGGITAESVAAVSDAGAAGFAAISLFARTPVAGIESLVRQLRRASRRPRSRR
jgi:thiamine-phosphate diphosphorylase